MRNNCHDCKAFWIYMCIWVVKLIGVQQGLKEWHTVKGAACVALKVNDDSIWRLVQCVFCKTQTNYDTWQGNLFQPLYHDLFAANAFPTLPKLQLEHAYTIFKSEFPLTRNKLIQALFRISECMGDLDRIMDSKDSDFAIINLIIGW